jgi:putative thioredoxin
MAFIIDPTQPQRAPQAKPSAPAGPGAPVSGKPAPGGDPVKNGATATFMGDVIEMSQSVPVIVDFWAPWCGPCKQLGPLLEKIVRQQNGLVRMVKINVDENQELAAQMRVQSIPAVYAFAGGQPVDGFVGALPESQLRAFVERLLGGAKSPLEAALAEATEALESGDVETAYAVYAEVLAQDAANAEATAGLLRTLIRLNRIDEAAGIVSKITEPLRSEARVSAAITAVDMACETKAAVPVDVSALEARLTTNPADIEARFELAKALYAAGRTEAALDHLIETVRRDRNWDDQAARRQIVKIFDALGPTDALTLAYRRKLSAVLFT